MSIVTVTGRLICADAAQAAIVARELPEHIRLTRAEPGCLRFVARQTDNPLIWELDEVFTDRAAYDAHRTRAAASRWARETVGIARELNVTGT
ncbi:putative quinol monooxygenase [Ruixingdingia sedimenti]|uniref:Antibiotic biosynthesis monooxygenase n=1 Tax=Ruixingdingia sedimenti TaxID=3073604 RepID=A0ABU1F8P1_9RHOB|nr:antibiotic biosynthesis monooxygenase [Xinfangfangia sp. LG-4]MDR5653240.1 antibiotic biosynthesis monooxygenase [Xinfangfangia sp. LG-4]